MKIIPIEELVDGGWYLGRCRNANIAQWDGKQRLFRYVRQKFESQFVESISYSGPGPLDTFDPIESLGRPSILPDLRSGATPLPVALSEIEGLLAVDVLENLDDGKIAEAKAGAENAWKKIKALMGNK